MTAYVLSKRVHVLQLNADTYAVAHGLLLQRMVISDSVYAALMLFAEQPLTEDDFVEGIELDVATPRETLTAMFRSFVEKRFVVPDDVDEDVYIRKHIG